MPNCWQPGDWKKFARQVRPGQSYYVIRELANHRAPFEDRQRYEEHVFTERAMLTGTPRTAGGMTATELCRNWGPVYDTQPRNMRASGEPGPQVAGPLGRNYEGVLDEAEMRGLEKRVRDGSNPKTRRPLGGWRV
ncbi:hypothetical protein ACFVAF_25365 [Streptomyces sp. NPDC057596]|uniref:hypothetical protein n=1 Tax=Streptomyces sp. NPDC057596 TaxID=3346178 RepID=UPI0036A33012